MFTFHTAGSFHPVHIHYGAGGINLLDLLGSVPGFGQKKMGKEAVGRGIDWGFSSPHTLLPKEEKEEKIAFSVIINAKRVPLNGSDSFFHQRILRKRKIPFKFQVLHLGLIRQESTKQKNTPGYGGIQTFKKV